MSKAAVARADVRTMAGGARRMCAAIAIACATAAVVGAAVAAIAGAPVLAGLAAALAVAAIGAAVLVLAAGSRARGVALALLAFGVAPCAFALRRAPAPLADAAIRSRWLDDRTHATWGAGLPERDLVALGAWLGLTANEYRAVDGMRGECAALANDAAAFGGDGSQVPSSWCCDDGHYWLARPAGDGPFPVLVFVHGSGGNFRCYARTLGLAAQARGVVAVFPTLGFGHWPAARGADRVLAVLDHVARDIAIDRARIAIVGLSAGADIALAAAARLPATTAVGLVAGHVVAPCPDLAGRRVAIWHGARDERVPVADVEQFAGAARARGALVELEVAADRDHVRLLVDRDVLVPQLLALATAVR